MIQLCYIQPKTRLLFTLQYVQHFSMEGEPSFKKQYDETLVVYSKRKSENTATIKKIQQLENNIITIQSEIERFVPKKTQEATQIDRSQADQLASQIQEYEQLINQIEREIHDEELSQLEFELSLSERILADVQSQLHKEQAQKRQEKEQLESLIKTAKSNLANEKAEIQAKISKKEVLQHQLSSSQDLRSEELQKQIKRLESKNAEIQKEIDAQAEIVQKKKAEKAAHQEEFKKKEKKERNFKQQIIEAEKTQESLNKQMNREKEKLAGVVKLSKTYVNQENLQILQKELNRHQAINNRVDLEVTQGKKIKQLKENQHLKSRIQYLKTTAKNMVYETQKIVKQLRQTGDNLVKQKLAQQKIFNQTTNKLNEYMKEYPNHEKNKQLQKIEEKKKRAEEKEKIRQAAKLQKERKKQEELAAKSAEQKPQLNADSPNLTAWEKWDQWQGKNLPARDETSIFNNRQFQLAVGVVAFISILFLVFG